MTQHIVNISGGKDSTACYLLALQRRRPFRAVMADTGNEHPDTIEYAATLHERTGGPRVEFFKADFTDRIAKKRAYVAAHWPQEGIPQAVVDRAIAALQPTGIPFLDLCIWKGRFPSRRAQFCTEFLKSEVIGSQVVDPARRAGPAIQWLGVRRGESIARRNSPMWQTIRTPGLHAMRYYRPLIHWTAQNVFSFAAAHGVDPNPLYLQGMSRVGCFPCINSNKDELRAISIRYPEAFERIEAWEAAAAEASKRGAGTFFAADVTPEGAGIARRLKKRAAAQIAKEHPDADDAQRERLERQRRNELSAVAPWPRAKQVAEWARTDRGGKQFSWIIDNEDDGLSCTSQYGLCE